MTSIDDDNRTDFAGIQALSSRAAGYAVAQKCLEVQAEAERRDPSLRSRKRVLLHEDARSWYLGALGEIEVGRMLSALGPEWFVRHAVPIGAGTKDVDHLVIGPGGVFAINTKHHSGANVWVVDLTLGVNNTKKPYLSAGKRDGIDVSKRLTSRVDFAVPVRSVVAIVDPQSLVDRRDPNNRPVAVVEARHLVRWLQNQPQQLSGTKLTLLKLAAEEPATWHIDPHAADTLRVMPRFERLVERLVEQTESKLVAGRGPARTAAPRPGRTRAAPRKKSDQSLLRLWGVVALFLGCAMVFRGIANQPCVTQDPVSCMMPVVWLGLKPLVILAMVASVAVGIICTLVWAVRRAVR